MKNSGIACSGDTLSPSAHMESACKRAQLIFVFVIFALSVLGSENSRAPELLSLYPLEGTPGSTLRLEIRGKNLNGLRGIWFDCESLQGEVLEVTVAKLPEQDSSSKDKRTKEEQDKDDQVDEAVLEVRIGADAKVGIHILRVFSPSGVSGPLPFYVNSERTVEELPGLHNTATSAQKVSFPSVINGKISQEGEVDFYAFQVRGGQEFQMEVLTGGALLPVAPGAFRLPELVVYGNSRSWFDGGRRKRLEGTDDTKCVVFPKRANTDYCLVRRVYGFPRDGRYTVQVGGEMATGGPNFVYQLRVVPSDPAENEKRWWPHAVVHPKPFAWREREFEATLEGDSVARVQTRSAGQTRDAVAQFLPALVEEEPNGTPEQAIQAPVPVIVEGRIGQPGDVDYFRFPAKAGQQLVFEVETPELAPHYFDPRITVRNAEGAELFTNIYRRIGSGSPHWIKSLERKTVFTFKQEGDYWLQVRDLTNQRGSDRCAYRILMRPAIPHVGNVAAQTDRINIAPGQAIKLTVISELEEGFAGEVAISVENLPAGVRALPAGAIGGELPSEPGFHEKRGAIHKERYRPVRVRTTIMLVAAKDAAPTPAPRLMRLSAEPVAKGAAGETFPFQELPLMVTTAAQAPPSAKPTAADSAAKQPRE